MAKKEPKEVKRKDLKSKAVYYFVNPARNVDVKSREVYKNADIEIHFPFYSSTGAQRYKGRLKYKGIKKIIYEGFSGKLPAGFLKAAKTGYGFTSELSPIIYTLLKKFPTLTEVVVSTNKLSKLDLPNKVTFSLIDLSGARPYIRTIRERQSGEKEIAANNILAGIFPKKFLKQEIEYKPNQLYEFVNSKSLKSTKLSEKDLSAISSLLLNLPRNHVFWKDKSVLTTKEKLDTILIEDLIIEYKNLMAIKAKSEALESKWQTFFGKNLLYFNFGYIEKFDKNVLLGDKALDIPDFIMLNTLGYLDVIDIKTHNTQLLSFDNGRRNFYWSGEASRAIAQAENYIDSLKDNEKQLITRIRDDYGFEVNAIRPKVYVIASKTDRIAGSETTKKYRGGLYRKMQNDFRRLNDSLHSIKFILYDELLENFENVLARLKTDSKSKAKS